jgi:hypothetical protein
MQKGNLMKMEGSFAFSNWFLEESLFTKELFEIFATNVEKFHFDFFL